MESKARLTLYAMRIAVLLLVLAIGAVVLIQLIRPENQSTQDPTSSNGEQDVVSEVYVPLPSIQRYVSGEQAIEIIPYLEDGSIFDPELGVHVHPDTGIWTLQGGGFTINPETGLITEIRSGIELDLDGFDNLTQAYEHNPELFIAFHNALLASLPNVLPWFDYNRDIPIVLRHNTGLDRTPTTIAAAWNTSYVIAPDNTLWTWGANNRHRFVIKTAYETSRANPDRFRLTYNTLPTRLMENVVAVSASENHTAIIKTDGSVWTWGCNSFGQIGDGTQTLFQPLDLMDIRRRPIIEDNIRDVPIRVMENAISVTAGNTNTMAIDSDNNLWAWGRISDRYVLVPEIILDNVYAASALSGKAIRGDGSLWLVLGEDAPQMLSEGRYISALSGGEVICSNGWIWGETGERWRHDFHIQNLYESMRTTGTEIIAITGYWGEGTYWLLSDGTIYNYHGGRLHWDSFRNEPLRGIITIAGAGSHTLAVMHDGSLWAWGSNWYGATGTGFSIAGFESFYDNLSEYEGENLDVFDMMSIQATFHRTNVPARILNSVLLLN